MDCFSTDGHTYRIQFVHSAHDLKYRLQGTPGGLRQFVDNLALSLRRRVTFCEISRAEEALLTKDAPVTTVWTPIAQGFALCHFHDQFVKREGRGYALKRALRVSGLSVEGQAELAYECGFDWEELQAAF